VIQFEATLRGGTVDPQISWDFDKQDGVQQQALGKSVKFVYKKPGDYLVTCTVTDKAGVRTPVTKVVGIKVEE
jgi:PKD repeat protein